MPRLYIALDSSSIVAISLSLSFISIFKSTLSNFRVSISAVSIVCCSLICISNFCCSMFLSFSSALITFFLFVNFLFVLTSSILSSNAFVLSSFFLFNSSIASCFCIKSILFCIVGFNFWYSSISACIARTFCFLPSNCPFKAKVSSSVLLMLFTSASVSLSNSSVCIVKASVISWTPAS